MASSALETRIVRALAAPGAPLGGDEPAWGCAGSDADEDACVDGAWADDGDEEEEEVVEVDEAQLLQLLDAEEPPLQARRRGATWQRVSAR